ncbi:MAG: secondary thiamine-phosphate synthase enzyme YjbQ [Candidatus Odinarchaeia archaeon]
MFFTKEIKFNTKGCIEIIDLTDKVVKIVEESGVKEGFALLFAPHATGIIGITEFDPPLLKDIKLFLEKIIPSNDEYNHPVNAFSHLRSLLLGTEKIIPITNYHLRLGTWQSIIWIETDTHPRTRTVIVQIVGKG